MPTYKNTKALCETKGCGGIPSLEIVGHLPVCFLTKKPIIIDPQYKDQHSLIGQDIHSLNSKAGVSRFGMVDGFMRLWHLYKKPKLYNTSLFLLKFLF